MQRQIQNLQISPSNSQSNISKSSRDQSSISTLSPSCKEVCTFSENGHEGIVFEYRIRDTAIPVYIIHSSHFGVNLGYMVFLGNLVEFVKSEERGKQTRCASG